MYKRYIYILLIASIGCRSSEKEQLEQTAQSEKILVSDYRVVKNLPLSHIFDTVTFIPLTNNKQGAVAIDKIFLLKIKS